MGYATIFVVVLIMALAAGCGGTEPYVFKKNEFDRSDANFNKPLADRDEVTICFNSLTASDRDVALVAEEECARFDRQAQAYGESFGACPLVVPTAAHFLCAAPSAPPSAPHQPVSAPAPE